MIYKIGRHILIIMLYVPEISQGTLDRHNYPILNSWSQCAVRTRNCKTACSMHCVPRVVTENQSSCTLTTPIPEFVAKDSQHQDKAKKKDQGHSQHNNERDEEILARRPNYRREKSYFKVAVNVMA